MDKIPPQGVNKGSKKRGLIRRDFLKMVAGGLALSPIAAVGIDRGSVLLGKRAHILRALKGEKVPTTEAIENAKKFLLDEYDVQVSLGDDWDDEESYANELSTVEAIQSLQFLIEEMAKYPTDFFERNKMTHIRIAKNVSLGHPLVKKGVGGFARSTKREFVLDFDPEDHDFFRKVFHHEVYHVLDFINSGVTTDEKWEQIHAGCSCASSVQRVKKNMHGYAIRNRSFINSYGETSPSEERAEYAAMMLMPKLHADFVRRLAVEKDEDREPLQRKYDAMKANFALCSGGKMDQAYWDAIIALAPEDISEDVGFGEGGYDFSSEGEDRYVYDLNDQNFTFENLKK